MKVDSLQKAGGQARLKDYLNAAGMAGMTGLGLSRDFLSGIQGVGINILT